jgi:predicted MFS family arabinose efflux permease
VGLALGVWVTVPAALLVLALSRVLPEPRPQSQGPLDLSGALLLTTGTVLVLLGLTSVPQGGWASGSAVVSGGLGIAALAGFLLVERRHAAPLVPLAVVLRRKVLVPNAAVTLESMVGMGWLYLLSLYFQQTMGLGPLETGLLFVPMTLASVVGAVGAGWAAPRWGVRLTAAAGLTLAGVGLLLMVLGVGGDVTVTVVVGMVVGETGFMLANVPLTLAGTAAVEEQDAGLAAGVLNTSMQLGGACGLAVVAVVAATLSGTAATLSTRAIESGLMLCLVAFCLPAVALSLAIVDRDYLLPERLPARASR